MSLEEQFPSEIPLPDAIQNPEELLAAWKNVRSTVEQILKSIADKGFVEASPQGGWNAGQNAEHLYKTQYGYARMIPATLKGRIGMDASELKKLSYKSLFRRASEPGKAKNPESVSPTETWSKERSLEELPKAMQVLEENFRGRTVEELRSRGFPHPLFGPVSLLDWTYILTAHEIAHGRSLARKYGL
jgi:hypothetical protein